MIVYFNKKLVIASSVRLAQIFRNKMDYKKHLFFNLKRVKILTCNLIKNSRKWGGGAKGVFTSPPPKKNKFLGATHKVFGNTIYYYPPLKYKLLWSWNFWNELKFFGKILHIKDLNVSYLYLWMLWCIVPVDWWVRFDDQYWDYKFKCYIFAQYTFDLFST